MVFASASGFMCATISRSCVRASVTTQVMRPSASNFGASTRPSSTSSVVAWGAKSDVVDTALLGLASAQALARGPAHQRDEPHLLGGIIAEQAGELARSPLCSRLLLRPPTRRE